jgi:hypothetical protein
VDHPERRRTVVMRQWASPFTEEPSPRGEDAREPFRSGLSEPDPLWLCRSAEVAVAGGGLAFSLKSVMMTVRSPTVTSRCCALLRSTFFNLGLMGKTDKRAEGLEEAVSTLSSCVRVFSVPATIFKSLSKASTLS